MPHSAWNAGCGVNYHHVGASMGRRFVPEKKVRFAEFELDFGSFQLFRAGKPVHLESLPLQLLMFLVENQRQLVSREEIADALWGKDVFVDVEQGINTAIRKVRMALEDDSTQPQYLQTVVGRGYRFVATINTDDGAGTSERSAERLFTPEELGQAIMAAAGLDPNHLKAAAKPRSQS
ncbi:MAG TPA: winged helix-turn-helix domain-containing protein [Bryobacteraceae bacterium]|nr:winged helix-turn-helix domain-containing protein [Bryobacteraceae bacterium]